MDQNPLQPIPNRECGGCNVCCRYPAIDAPQLHKPPNVLCQHWKNGCSIYNDRPDVCRAFYCGWRLMPNLNEAWRPDRSNIFLRPVQTEDGTPGIDITLIGSVTPNKKYELMLYIGELVTSQIPTFVVIPGPPGHGSTKVLLNNRMKAAIETRHYETVLTAFEDAVRAAQAFETRPMGFGPEASAP
ncbi:MAG TPA: hypothetical protein VGH02_13300 [Rhizomicrobium sp.]|jgi:hypothetical protein